MGDGGAQARDICAEDTAEDSVWGNVRAVSGGAYQPGGSGAPRGTPPSVWHTHTRGPQLLTKWKSDKLRKGVLEM